MTSNSRVFAIGDVIGRPQFTHVANYHAGIVIRRALFRLPAKVDDEIIPWVTFTDPELAHVGLTEDAARKRHGRVRVFRWPYHENDRAQAERATEGFVKVVTDAKGRILGASIVGEHAGELIQMWSLAVSQGLDIKAMTQWISPYPTFSEINKRVAYGYYATAAAKPAGAQGGRLAGESSAEQRGRRVPRDSIDEALAWPRRLWERVKTIRSPRGGNGGAARAWPVRQAAAADHHVRHAGRGADLRALGRQLPHHLADRPPDRRPARGAGGGGGRDGIVPDALRTELLRTAQVRAVSLKRNNERRLVLPADAPAEIDDELRFPRQRAARRRLERACRCACA